jgi:acyl carrier protein
MTATVQLSTQEAIASWLVQRFAQIAQVGPSAIDVERPFADYELDSAVAVTVSQELSAQVGHTLPITLFWEYPSIASLSSALGTDG